MKAMLKTRSGQIVGAVALVWHFALVDWLGNTPAGERIVLFKVHREAQALYFEPAIEAISEVGGDIVHVLEQKQE